MRRREHVLTDGRAKIARAYKGEYADGPGWTALRHGCPAARFATLAEAKAWGARDKRPEDRWTIEYAEYPGA